MGGIRKTALAVEYVYRYRDQYAGACWCRAETRISLLSSLGVGTELQVVAADEADIEKMAEATLRWLSEQTRPSCSFATT
jgi:hypothetical protein